VEDSPVAGFPVPHVDTSRPHSARMYDYLLGSKSQVVPTPHTPFDQRLHPGITRPGQEAHYSG
jgi:hypothetical protein